MTGRVTIGIVDYGMGNRRSVQKALDHVGARTVLAADIDHLQASDGLVVPGVGAFPQGMRNLSGRGLDALVRGWAHDRRPLLGICLGMQLLFERSDELAATDGLSLIPGQITRLQSAGMRIPHIGWNDVRFERPSALTAGLPVAGRPFYHVHSFAARPSEPDDVVGTTLYGERFTTIVARGSVFGVQFHPEKSSADGLRLLRNFVQICRSGSTDMAWGGSAGSISLPA